jgi:hypothetical protein
MRPEVSECSRLTTVLVRSTTVSGQRAWVLSGVYLDCSGQIGMQLA